MPKTSPDEIAAFGLLADGILASLHYSAGPSAGWPMTWEIKGDRGSLLIGSTQAGYIHMGDLTIILRRGEEAPRQLAIPTEYGGDDHGLGGGAAGVARLYARFAADLAEGTATVPEFGTAAMRHRLLDAIMRPAGTTVA